MLKQRGRVFWTTFKSGGKRYRLSTGCTDINEARDREAELKKEKRFEKFGWKKPEPEASSKPKPVPGLTEWWQGTYKPLFECEPKKTIRTQTRDEQMIAPALSFFGDRPMNQVTKLDCERYVAIRRRSFTRNPGHRRRRLAEGTVSREISFLQAVWEPACDEFNFKNPWRKVDRKGYKARIRILSPEDQRKLEPHIPPPWLAWFHFTLGTGARLDESRNLRPRDVDFVAETVRLTGKFGKTRIVALAPELIVILKRVIQNPYRRAKNFHRKNPRTRHEDSCLWNADPSWFREMLREACEAAGVPRISPHDLRHVFGHRFLKNGGDIYLLSKILGHESVVTTQKHYSYLSADDVVANSRPVMSGIAGIAGGTKRATPARKRA